MVRANAGRVLLAGFVATLAMTLTLWLLGVFGVPTLDIASSYGQLLGDVEPGNQIWWLGMIVHFTIGTIILAFLYANQFSTTMSGSTASRGMVYGVVLWLIVEILVMPLTGNGFFSAEMPNPASLVISTLVGFLVFGAVLGAIVGTSGEYVETHTTRVVHS